MTINNAAFNSSFVAAVLYSTKLRASRLEFDGEFWQFKRGDRVYRWEGPAGTIGNAGFFPLDHRWWRSRSTRGREDLVRKVQEFGWFAEYGWLVHRPASEEELSTGELPDPPADWTVNFNGTFVEYRKIVAHS